MYLIAAICSLGLAVFHGYIFHRFHTDVTFITSNIFIAAGLICLAIGSKKK